MKKINFRKINDGFSLMEVLIWCAIAGIFSSLVGIAGFSFIEKQKVKATIQEMSIYSAAILDYYSDEGTYPSSEQGLQILVERGYVTKSNFKDKWNNDYIYTVEGDNGFTIKSLGSDKKEGGNGTKKDLVESHIDNNDELMPDDFDE